MTTFLFANARTALIAGCISALLLAWVMHGVVPDEWLIAWVITVFAVNGARFAAIRGQRAQGGGDASRVARYTAGTLVSGIVWGTAGVLFFPPESIHHQVFLGFVLGGMVAGSVASYAAWLPAFYAFAGPVLVPITLRFFVEGNEMSAVMGGLLVIYGVALAVLTHNVNRVLKQSVDLQADLRKSEKRFRDIAEGATDWIWETDADYRCTFLSPHVAQVLGRPAEYFVGRSRLDDPGLVEDSELLDKLRSDLAARRPFRDFEYAYMVAPDNVVVVSVNGKPVFDEAGDYVGYRGTTTNITERKRAEEALRESEERHRRFAADAAHEMRTPLAVLRSNLDSLDDAKAAISLRQDVDAMTRLVEQLLAATQLDFLEVGADDQADLCRVCTNVAAQLAPLAIKEKRSIQVTGCKRPVSIRGHTDSLEQAVRNLVENSLRYSRRGSTVTLRVDDDASISVIDEGPGIKADQQERIFQRFVRADRRSGGAGLGLSIVRRTVDAHGGSIDIADTPGGGATFTLRFAESVAAPE